MKFELDDKDKKYIDNINKDLNSGVMPPIFINQIGKEYHLNLSVPILLKQIYLQVCCLEKMPIS